VIILKAIPPHGLVLLAIVAIQVGAALAFYLFEFLGPNGTVAARIIISAIVLSIIAGKSVRTFGKTFRAHWVLLLAFGMCLAFMNIFFFQALARIPLGTVVAIDFMGPLGVAVFTSRRLSHFAWIALAAVGIALLSPITGVNLDMIGVGFAMLAGVSWALFVILAARVGKRIPGSNGLAVAMIVAATVMIPFAIPIVTTIIFNPLMLLAVFGVAMLSTAIPMTLEFKALKQLPARTYGILVSLEPGVATLVGAALLGEQLNTQGVIAIACVITAAIGITVSDNQKTA
jgi:inner membrane transporter RhtA